MKINVAVADELRAELARRRQSQAELSDALHMTPPQVSRRLSGTTPITVDDLVAICRWLRVSPGEVLDRVESRQGCGAKGDKSDDEKRTAGVVTSS